MCAGRLAFHGSPARMECFHQKLAKLGIGGRSACAVLRACNMVQHRATWYSSAVSAVITVIKTHLAHGISNDLFQLMLRQVPVTHHLTIGSLTVLRCSFAVV